MSRTPLFSTGIILLDVPAASYTTFFVSQMLAWLASIAILIVAFKYCWRKPVARYMRGLPFYFFVSDLTEVVANIVGQDRGIYVYWAFVYFETVYLIYFFFLLLGSSSRRYSHTAVLLVFIPSLAVYFFTKRPWVATGVAGELESIALIIPSVIYYRDLFARPKIPVLEKDPGFWMVTGIFFYFFIRIPVVWFTAYYYRIASQDFSMGIYSINNYSLVISFALYTKAMVCLKV